MRAINIYVKVFLCSNSFQTSDSLNQVASIKLVKLEMSSLVKTSETCKSAAMPNWTGLPWTGSHCRTQTSSTLKYV